MKKAKTLLAPFIYGLLFCVAGLSLWLLFRTKAVEVEIVSVQKKSFEEILTLDGVVRSTTKFTVTAFTTGDLDRIDLKVGDPVSKNQKITTLHWDLHKSIVSPVDGIISKIYRDSAGPVARGEPLVDIIDPINLEVVVEALTTDAVRLNEGTRAYIDAFGMEPPLPAKVRRISRAGFVKLSALGIEEEKTPVYLKFLKNPPSSIGDNFHVEVHFIISQRNNVLTVPAGALFKDEDSWAVYTLEKNRARLRIVKLEVKTDTAAVVSSGLKEGDLVILFPSDLISDGRKVKARSFK
ncbi:hypothetical protein AZI87_01590 [Bdellovibrio bacteriovorus]|uniref:RND efflux pump membrane fusion protein barrel-sandwich domain-containing protein n=1 Tax=Bdellovibrio bacteriovorus TaxID=959 RepID=A0A162GF03_BDEBC|nr:HlyD family efflux transporter periplasmic adaptor subunit [Bdellovibrio bacteriovorus]KYG67990.1 hypothetical protein AZI87_01590 [Bdellovibrio bacteriovorus]